MKFAPKLTALLISIGAIVAAIMCTIAYFQVAKILEGEIRAHMESRVIITMDALDRFLSRSLNDIKIIADDPVISSGNATAEQVTERLIFFRNTYKWYGSLSFFNLERIRIADTSGMKIGEQNRMTRYWEDVLSGKVSAASDVHISEDFKVPVVYFASTVKNKEGKGVGVVVTRILQSRLFEMVKGSMGSQEEEEEIDIVNKDGLLIYSNHNREGILKENLPEWESIKIDQQEKIFGSAKHQHPGEKETTLYVFCRERGYLDFKGNDWVIISHIPLRVIFGPVNNLLKRLIIMFLVMLPGLAFVIYLFSKTVTRPLTRLSFAAVEIGKGKLDTVIEVKSKDEIGSLANTFNEMAADLKKTTTSIDDLNKEITERKRIEEVLRDSEAGFRAIFDNANDGILLADEETKKFYTGNNTACQMLGYSLEEIKNLGVPDIHPKEDLPYVIEQFEKQVRREIAVAKDLPVKRKNGSVFYADVNTSLIILAGRTYLLGLFRDITEHKRAEEEREKLIHELQDALGKIKTLSGLLPICASCKKIRDDKGYWNQIEAYIGDHSEAEFTHSICPECMKKLYPDF
jgi:PAS domain S-box-containing protein